MNIYSVYTNFELEFILRDRHNNEDEFMKRLLSNMPHVIYECVTEDQHIETDYQMFIEDNLFYIRVGDEFIKLFNNSKTEPWHIFRIDFDDKCFYLTISDQRKNCNKNSLSVTECCMADFNSLNN